VGLFLDLGFPSLGCASPPPVIIAFFGEEMLPIGEDNSIQFDALQYGEGRGNVERPYLAVSLLHSHLHLIGIVPSGMVAINGGLTLICGVEIG